MFYFVENETYIHVHSVKSISKTSVNFLKRHAAEPRARACSIGESRNQNAIESAVYAELAQHTVAKVDIDANDIGKTEQLT